MARIESYIEPATLYRYRPLDAREKVDREIGSIMRAQLFCAAYNKLNDPMEGIYTATPEFREGDGNSLIRQAIRDRKLGIGLCSFSELKDNELMWTHYADEFRGICIAYDFRLLLGSLSDEESFVRMSYSEEEPRVDNCGEPVEILARRSLSSKSYRWLYEREWRMFAAQGVIHYQNTRCVTAVYLGYRISPRRSEKIRKAMSNIGIPVHRMFLKKYSIAFEELG